MKISHRDWDRVTPKPAADAPIAVGVDGTESSLVAVEWAGSEATSLGCGVRLVHAYPADVYGHPATPIGQERAEIAFEAARERLRPWRQDALEVSTRAFQGSAPRVLLRVALEARMLVVGREHTGWMSSLLSTSTAVACAAHAVLPVTVVPMSWARSEPERGVVVLGVDGSRRCLAAVGHAFGLAAARNARLLAVLALNMPAAYPQGWPLGSERAKISADGRRQLALSLRPWRSGFPGVDVNTVVDERSPVEALIDHAVDADRLVIGGRGHGLMTGALLGSVARTLVRRAPCPATVVHSHAEGEAGP